MSRALSDGHIHTPRTRLPESVDRLIGVPSADPEPQLTETALGAIIAKLDAEIQDSNIDRMSWNREIDVLFDGTLATRAMVAAVRRRVEHPVVAGEAIRITETR